MPEASTPFSIERLSDAHDRASFACGVEPLDRYFATQVSQDIRRRVAACFVAVDRATAAIAGFYTISASSLPLTELSAGTIKKLPRYPLVPAVRVGRLAVALPFRGKGIGSGLLVDAIARAVRAEIMAFAMVVDAKDEAASAFYRHHGFLAFESQPMALYLPMAEAAKALTT